MLATRLDSLFRFSMPGNRHWTNDEVAEAIKQTDPELRVSGSYLSALRKGRRTRPSPELQAALAKFFGVSPAYFVDAEYAEQVDCQLALLDQLRQAGVQGIALRAIGLPQDSLEAITAVLDQIRRQRGLPPVDDENDQ
ncbi:helix-turn-helix protein [Kutzneria buriramensis]|uniref:Helix-turn-helix protein n=1 Tax=Kutzneria buriramensis TaxID=1045776 RepID=A0A3E0G8E8_9PSEU|nr:helix-turn-helix protein [Kutzneria buriramensis]